MRPGNNWNIQNLTDVPKALKQLTLFLKDVYNILTKGIIFSDNVRGNQVSASFTTANVDLAIPHGLSYIPTSYIVVGSSAATQIFNVKKFDTTNVYLRSSQIATIQVFIY